MRATWLCCMQRILTFSSLWLEVSDACKTSRLNLCKDVAVNASLSPATNKSNIFVAAAAV